MSEPKPDGPDVLDHPLHQFVQALKALLENNGGPIRSVENEQQMLEDDADLPEDYVMVRREDYDAVAAAMHTWRQPTNSECEELLRQADDWLNSAVGNTMGWNNQPAKPVELVQRLVSQLRAWRRVPQPQGESAIQRKHDALVSLMMNYCTTGQWPTVERVAALEAELAAVGAAPPAPQLDTLKEFQRRMVRLEQETDLGEYARLAAPLVLDLFDALAAAPAAQAQAPERK